MRKRNILLPCTLITAMLISGCGAGAGGAAIESSAAYIASDKGSESGSDISEAITESTADGTEAAGGVSTVSFSDRDFRTEYDESTAVVIALNGSSAETTDSRAVSISGSTVTISDEGCYILSGELKGQLIIDAEKTDKIQLVLKNVSISSESSAAIYVRSADKVFITTAAGSENTLSNEGEYVAIDENNIDAVIYSKEDLTLNGEGILIINAAAGHGVVCKDELVITSGEYKIKVAEDGFSSNDGFGMAGGDIEISAGDDGIRSDGAVLIQDGVINITGSYEGIEGLTIDITGGKIDIVSSDDGMSATNGSGSTELNPGEGEPPSPGAQNQNVEMSEGGGRADRGGFELNGNPGKMQIPNQAEPPSGTPGAGMRPDANGNSNKGFGGRAMFSAQEGVYVSISGGVISIYADGDGIDSNGDLYISGGEIYISTSSGGADGSLDYDGEGIITGGILIGTGAAGMAQNLGQNSTQGSILLNTGENASGTQIVLKDSSGSELLSWVSKRSFSSVVISTADISSSGSYTLQCGDNETEISMDGYIYGSGGMGGGQRFGDKGMNKQ